MNEVATMRAQIDQDIQAMKQLQKYASIAGYELITHRFKHFASCFERLAAEVGTATAIMELTRKMAERF